MRYARRTVALAVMAGCVMGGLAPTQARPAPAPTPAPATPPHSPTPPLTPAPTPAPFGPGPGGPGGNLMPAAPQALGSWASDLMASGALEGRYILKDRQGRVRTRDGADLEGLGAAAIPSRSESGQLFRLDEAAKARAGFGRNLDVYVVKK